jgi:hypothetical protein
MNGMNSGTIVKRFPRNGVEGKMKWGVSNLIPHYCIYVDNRNII